MPHMTVVKDESGKFRIVSRTEAEGGPPDKWLGVTEDKAFSVFEGTTAKDEAEEFLRENGGGNLYLITHYKHHSGTPDEEWLPKSYPRGKVHGN